MSVTLYQFTRGLPAIPDDLGSRPIQDEMTRAKAGIQQAVQLGYWQAAKEVENGIVPLGGSGKQALWSRYSLTVGGTTARSDIYVWSHNNALFKLRCTRRSKDAVAETKVLLELLTASARGVVRGLNERTPERIPSEPSTQAGWAGFAGLLGVRAGRRGRRSAGPLQSPPKPPAALPGWTWGWGRWGGGAVKWGVGRHVAGHG